MGSRRRSCFGQQEGKFPFGKRETYTLQRRCRPSGDETVNKRRRGGVKGGLSDGHGRHCTGRMDVKAAAVREGPTNTSKCSKDPAIDSSNTTSKQNIEERGGQGRLPSTRMNRGGGEHTYVGHKGGVGPIGTRSRRRAPPGPYCRAWMGSGGRRRSVRTTCAATT